MDSKEADEGELIRRLRVALQPADDAAIAKVVAEARADFPKPYQGTVEVLGHPAYPSSQVHEWLLKWFGATAEE